MSASSQFLATDGNGYEAQMGRWSRRLAPLLIDFAAISVANCVLDAGCGTGSLTFALANNPHVGLVTGVDLASEYIAHASKHRADPRVRFEVGDVTRLRFEDASFDHTLSSLVLQFVPEPDRVEMRRVTRPGGIVAAPHGIRGAVSSCSAFFSTQPP